MQHMQTGKRAEYKFQKKYESDFGWVSQGCLFTVHNKYAKYIPMHSAARQKTFQPSLHACVCLKISRLLFFSLEEFGSEGVRHFCELFSVLKWLYRTCNKSLHEQRIRNPGKWMKLMGYEGMFRSRLLMRLTFCVSFSPNSAQASGWVIKLVLGSDTQWGSAVVCPCTIDRIDSH